MSQHFTLDPKQPFILAGREVRTIQLQVLGHIQENIRLGVEGVEVTRDGRVVVNLTPEFALAMARELVNLARKASR